MKANALQVGGGFSKIRTIESAMALASFLGRFAIESINFSKGGGGLFWGQTNFPSNNVVASTTNDAHSVSGSYVYFDQGDKDKQSDFNLVQFPIVVAAFCTISRRAWIGNFAVS